MLIQKGIQGSAPPHFTDVHGTDVHGDVSRNAPRNAPRNTHDDVRRDLLSLRGQSRFLPLVRYRPGDSVFALGDRPRHLYLVDFGCVRICRLSSEGRRQVSAFHFPGEVFGFEGQAERQYFAQTVESAGIRVFPVNDDNRCSPEVVDLMFRHLAMMQEHLLVLGTQNAVERVAAFLLEIAERQNGGGLAVRLPMPRGDIADYLGMTLETVSRMLHQLQQMQYIRLINARSIVFLDLAALKSMTE